MSAAATERILIIEDDAALARVLGRMLAKQGYGIEIVNSLGAARIALGRRVPDVVLADMALPDGRGVEIVREMADEAPGVPLIIMTGMPSVDSAVAALRAQAFDYLAKPFTKESLNLILKRALEVSRLRREVSALKTSLAISDCGLVGRSSVIQGIRDRIRCAAGSMATVLVTGETGVGKERVARAIHEHSGRSGSFVPINCGAVPEALFEAELFGSKRGSFTGAIADRAGLVAEAAGGTLFLDEIGDMPSPLQPKVLRLLQERTYRSVGRDKESRADIRVLAATNRPLMEMVQERHFREDLYWRLAVVEIPIPPLRERREDVVTLTAHILTTLSARLGTSVVPTVSQAALDALERHQWPGNVRELENVLERALLFCRTGRIEESDLSLSVSGTSTDMPELDEVMRVHGERTEREYLVKVIRLAENSMSRAAQLAGRNRTAFYRLLEKHQLRVEDRRESR